MLAILVSVSSTCYFIRHEDYGRVWCVSLQCVSNALKFQLVGFTDNIGPANEDF